MQQEAQFHRCVGTKCWNFSIHLWKHSRFQQIHRLCTILKAKLFIRSKSCVFFKRLNWDVFWRSLFISNHHSSLCESLKLPLNWVILTIKILISNKRSWRMLLGWSARENSGFRWFWQWRHFTITLRSEYFRNLRSSCHKKCFTKIGNSNLIKIPLRIALSCCGQRTCESLLKRSRFWI
jgi:hypothetical protein